MADTIMSSRVSKAFPGLVVALLSLIPAAACMRQLPPAPPPERLVPPVDAAQPRAEGDGRLVIDVVEGPTRIYLVRLHPEPVPKPSPEPVGEPLPEPVDEPLPEPVDEPLPEPVDESLPEPVDEPLPEPVDEPLPEPVDEPLPEPVDEPVPEPVDEPVPETVDDTQGGRVHYAFEERLELLCEASPCVADLRPGNVVLGFPRLGDGEIELELVHVSSDATVYRRSLSHYERNQGAVFITGVLGAMLGGTSAIAGATMLPIGLAKDDSGFKTSGTVTLTAGAIVLAYGIWAIRHDSPTYRPGSSAHFPIAP
jgi:hypothetical protein